MALCLAHATAGYVAYEAMRPPGSHRPGLLLGAVVLANAPDLDFLPGIAVGTPLAFHRGVTHTMLAVVAVAVAAALVATALRRSRVVGPPAWWACFAGIAYATHLLVDWSTADAVAPYGAQFLWPLSAAFYHAPFSLFGEIVVDPHTAGGFFTSIFTGPPAWVAWTREVLVAGLGVSGVQALRAARGAIAVGVAERSES